MDENNVNKLSDEQDDFIRKSINKRLKATKKDR